MEGSGRRRGEGPKPAEPEVANVGPHGPKDVIRGPHSKPVGLPWSFARAASSPAALEEEGLEEAVSTD
jgi:hypothetical protein